MELNCGKSCATGGFQLVLNFRPGDHAQIYRNPVEIDHFRVASQAEGRRPEDWRRGDETIVIRYAARVIELN